MQFQTPATQLLLLTLTVSLIILHNYNGDARRNWTLRRPKIHATRQCHEPGYSHGCRYPRISPSTSINEHRHPAFLQQCKSGSTNWSWVRITRLICSICALAANLTLTAACVRYSKARLCVCCLTDSLISQPSIGHKSLIRLNKVAPEISRIKLLHVERWAERTYSAYAT